MRRMRLKSAKRAIAFLLAFCMTAGIMPTFQIAFAADATLTIDGVTDYDKLTPYTQYALKLTDGTVTYSADDGLDEFVVKGAQSDATGAAIYPVDKMTFKEGGVKFSGTVEPSDMGYISQRGYFIAQKPGEAVISVTATDGTTELSGKLEVTVVSKDKYEYNFMKVAKKPLSATAHYTAHIKWTEFSTYAHTTAGDDKEINPFAFMLDGYLEDSDPWCYSAHEYGGKNEAPRNFSYAYVKTGNNIGPQFRYNNWVRFKVMLPEDGKYIAISQQAKHKGNVEFDVYLAPVEDVDDDGANPDAAEYKLGHVDANQETAEYHAQDKLGAYDLSAGEYYLTYRVTDFCNQTYMSFDSFILERVGDTDMEKGTLSVKDANPAELESYGQYALEISDGATVLSTGAAGVVFTGSVTPADAGYITRDGYLVTQKKGEATIKINATDGTNVLCDTIDITVKPANLSLDLTIDGVTDYNTLTPYSHYPLKLSNGSITISADDGLDDYKVTADVVDGNTTYAVEKIAFKEGGMRFIGTVEPSDMGYISERGYFIAQKPGTATIEVGATDGENIFSGTMEVTVVSKDLYKYNFLKIGKTPVDSAIGTTVYAKWANFSEFANTTAGDDVEMHPQAFMTNAGTRQESDPWRFDAHNGTGELEAPRSFNLNYGGNLFRGTWARFEVRVPEDGKYTAISQHSKDYRSGWAFDVYLAPSAEVDAGASPTDEKYKLDNVDQYIASGSAFHVQQALGVYDLAAGDYYLTYYVTRPVSGSGKYMYLDSFILDRVGMKDEEKGDLTVKDTSADELTSYTTYALELTDGQNVISAGTDGAVFTGTVEPASAGYVTRDGYLITQKSGEATVKVNAARGGNAMSSSLEIKVSAVDMELNAGIDGVEDLTALTPYTQYPIKLSNTAVTMVGDMAGITFSGEVSPTDAGYVSARGYYIAKKPGNAVVTVTATDGESSFRGTMNVTVVSKDEYTYNFQKAATKPVDSSAAYTDHIKWTEFETFAHTTAGDDAELHRQADMVTEGTREITDPWCYAAHYGDDEEEAPRNFAYGYGGNYYGPYFRQEWIRFKIRLPEDGEYEVISQNANYNGGSVIGYYLAPADEVDMGVSPVTGIYKVGELDTYRETAAESEYHKRTGIGTETLRAGDYYLTLKVEEKNAAVSTVNIAVDSVSLKRVGEYSDERYVYNFMKVATRAATGLGEDNTKNIPLTDITGYDKTTPGENEIYPESVEKTDPWYYLGVNAGATIPFIKDYYNSGMYFNGVGNHVQFMIDLPEGGIYQPISINALLGAGAVVEYYLAPKGAADTMAEEYKLAELDTYSSEIDSRRESMLKVCRLDAGEYILTYRIKGTNPLAAGSAFVFDSFVLKKVDRMPTAQISVDKAKNVRVGLVTECAINFGMDDGSYLDATKADITVTPRNSGIVSVEVKPNENKTKYILAITGLAPGATVLDISAKLDENTTLTTELDISVRELILGSVAFELTGTIVNEDENLLIKDKAYPVVVTLLDDIGVKIPNSAAEITFDILPADMASLEGEFTFRSRQVGNLQATVSVSLNGVTLSADREYVVREGKDKVTIYTEDKIAAARENIANYSWARSMKDAAVNAADKYVENIEFMWNTIPGNTLPRAASVGFVGDPDAYSCRHPDCGVDIRANYGMYAWKVDPFNSPWKIQCPECRRKFPTNDFESFYRLGLDEHGVFDRALAYQRNNELIAQGHPGYLVNTLYPELGADWGVDDGFGYKPGRIYENGVEECHTYIAFYLHYGLWYNNSGNPGILEHALNVLREAYLYTGEAKYGRAGAIIVDRIADLYPDMDLYEVCGRQYMNSHDTAQQGKAIGAIWECRIAEGFVKAYDAFYPAMEDPYVINFLSQKAKQYKLGNPKTDADLIRANCDDGILRAVFKGAADRKIAGNMGMHQSAVAYAAVALNTLPETKDWIDWILRSETTPDTGYVRPGGNIYPLLIKNVDRDGFGYETSPGYNAGWVSNFAEIAEALDGYELYPDVDLYKNPKYQTMFSAFVPLTMTRNTTIAIGDSGGTALPSFSGMDLSTFIKGFNAFGDIVCAQAAYFINGNTAKGLYGDIFDSDNDTLEARIQAVIDEYGEYDFDRSNMLPSYGFAALRGGGYYKGATDTINTQHDFWLRFGAMPGHTHYDSMSMGIHAYGLDFAPELGYPEATSGANHDDWQVNTISHNTVVVNEVRQERAYDSKLAKYDNGLPLHYDASEYVKVIDADMPEVYPGVADIYRRTLIMVKVNDEVSYGVDFFRIKGGNDHLYSFHALSNSAAITGVTQVAQEGGSYAGADVPWGTEKIEPAGYSWLKDVRRADNPGTGSFMVDFEITDFRKTIPTNAAKDLHLRMYMTNTFDVDEVTLAKGLAPRRVESSMIEPLEYVLVRHKGENNLDTLFASVFEPYKETPYIKSVENMVVEPVEGTPKETDRAQVVKVTHTDGRADYIVYSTNNLVKYKVVDNGEDVFSFCGAIGVYSVNGDERVFTYLNDGTVIEDAQGEAVISSVDAITGQVVELQRDLSADNFIEVNIDQSIEPESLVGKYIYIENGLADNAVYLIEGVSTQTENDADLRLDVGKATTIAKYSNELDITSDYVYYFERGQDFRIPLATLNVERPVFNSVSDKNVAAGSKVTINVSATGQEGRSITYTAKALPRGASFDEDTLRISWTPDGNQIGDHYIAIEAFDGVLSATQYIKITVYKAAGSSSPTIDTDTSGGTSDSETGLGSGSSSGSGSGGGAGGGSSGGETSGSESAGGETGGEASDNGNAEITGERFVDLGGFDWAKEAVYYLVDLGVVNGTSTNTYSPSKNITRADFAIMLTRAFNITEGEGKNFADVDASAYYAEELRLAKAAGIVNGVGENKFNPSGEITRQDMMLMLARALDAAGWTLSDADLSVLSQFTDSADISDYAKDAVSRLVKDAIIAGSGGRINPLYKATRAEVAVMLSRVIAAK